MDQYNWLPSAAVATGAQLTMVVDLSVLLTAWVQVSHTVSSTFSVHEQPVFDGSVTAGLQKIFGGGGCSTWVVTLRHPSFPV